MAGITKVNPAATTTNVELVGRDFTFLIVDYDADVSASAGPTGIQQQVLRAIENAGHTIEAIGPLVDTGSQQTFAVSGGPVDATSITALEAAIVATDAAAGATVTVTKLGILKAAAVA
jgi:hypothetical protein